MLFPRVFCYLAGIQIAAKWQKKNTKTKKMGANARI